MFGFNWLWVPYTILWALVQNGVGGFLCLANGWTEIWEKAAHIILSQETESEKDRVGENGNKRQLCCHFSMFDGFLHVLFSTTSTTTTTMISNSDDDEADDYGNDGWLYCRWRCVHISVIWRVRLKYANANRPTFNLFIHNNGTVTAHTRSTLKTREFSGMSRFGCVFFLLLLLLVLLCFLMAKNMCALEWEILGLYSFSVQLNARHWSACGGQLVHKILIRYSGFICR